MDTLHQLLGSAGLDVEAYESAPGRTSLVARIDSTDPGAPRLYLASHMDVVPVDADGWAHDPFGGELIDGEVWAAARSISSTSRPRWLSPSATSPPGSARAAI